MNGRIGIFTFFLFRGAYGSLNPRMTVGNVIGEALKAQGADAGFERKKQ